MESIASMIENAANDRSPISRSAPSDILSQADAILATGATILSTKASEIDWRPEGADEVVVIRTTVITAAEAEARIDLQMGELPVELDEPARFAATTTCRAYTIPTDCADGRCCAVAADCGSCLVTVFRPAFRQHAFPHHLCGTDAALV